MLLLMISEIEYFAEFVYVISKQFFLWLVYDYGSLLILCDYNLFFTLKAIWIGELVDTGGGLSMTTGTTTRKK